MRTSDEWVIIGYSLPPEDIAIRSLLVRAFHARGDKREPRIRVVQKGENLDMQSRYKLFFPKCEYISGGLETMLGLNKRY